MRVAAGETEGEARNSVLLHHQNPWYYVHSDQNSCIQPTSHSCGSLRKRQRVGLLAITHRIGPALRRTWGERGGTGEGLITRMNRLMGRGCPQ